MNDKDPKADDKTRIIVLVYGMLDSGGPCWLFVAIRPNRYQAFLTAHKEGKLEFKQFVDYGEIIVSGDGKSPPQEVIVKVAEMYQTDPATLMQGAKDPEKVNK